MSRIAWDDAGKKIYETGLDRGVLYLPDDTTVPWNGLLSVDVSDGEVTVEPYYFDGSAYYVDRSNGEFSATLKAYTYPDEFMPFDGYQSPAPGLFVTDQYVDDVFGLSYRTLIGNDLEGTDFAYKIHILYNLTASPSSNSYESSSDSPDAIEFGWELMGNPVEVPGFRPTVHFIIDSRYISKSLMSSIEELLYGGHAENGRLPLASELTYILQSNLISVVDNGDGTWTATGPDDAIFLQSSGEFAIDSPAATFIALDEYEIAGDVVSIQEGDPDVYDPDAVNQSVVVPQTQIVVGQPITNVALFNPDGTPLVIQAPTDAQASPIAFDTDGVPYLTRANQ